MPLSEGLFIAWDRSRMNKSSIIKKRIERFQLDQFQELFSDFPEGEIEVTEEPDFLIHCSPGTIGVELTELHRDVPPGVRPQQANEEMKRRVMARAQKLYDEYGLPPIRVSVLFSLNHEIQKHEVEALAQNVFRIAMSNLPDVGKSFEESYNWINRHYFSEKLNKIFIHRWEGIDKSHFNAPGATWVGALSVDDILRALYQKEGKIQKYRGRCNNLWLLIIMNTQTMSTWFEHDPNILLQRFNTDFDRVFILNHFQGQVYELMLKPPPRP